MFQDFVTDCPKLLQIASKMPKAKAKTRVLLVHLLGPILGLFVRDGEVKHFVSGADGKGQKYWKTKIFRQLKDKEKFWTGWTGKALS